jgi:hypothetical protein
MQEGKLRNIAWGSVYLYKMKTYKPITYIITLVWIIITLIYICDVSGRYISPDYILTFNGIGFLIWAAATLYLYAADDLKNPKLKTEAPRNPKIKNDIDNNYKTLAALKKLAAISMAAKEKKGKTNDEEPRPVALDEFKKHVKETLHTVNPTANKDPETD